MQGSNEKKFLEQLQDIFVGAKIEGKSGYINLLNMKQKYYTDIQAELNDYITEKISSFPDFREELFDKLHSFFSRYFTKNGSLYFNETPFHKSVYEKVYTDHKDIMLFYKTNMLYYVKSDVIIKNAKITVDDTVFHFDTSELQYKKSNEKKELIFELHDVKKETVYLTVQYSERGRKTKLDQIVKGIEKSGLTLSEETITTALATFKKQSTYDYFINKDAKAFLEEQFELWLYQYTFKEMNQFSAERVQQLQALKDIAYQLIAFIAQFEEELKKVWNKPKFALNSHYVISVDRLTGDLFQQIIEHRNIEQQVEEWKEFEIVPDTFTVQHLLENKSDYPYLAIDTKYFKDKELSILALFDHLDEALDGWLIHSENYQALNTILPKFKRKIQAIYIDPPFNKESEGEYHYSVKYKDSTWVTILENRVRLAKELLKEDGSMFLRCDYNGNALVRLLMDDIFEKRNFLNELVVNRTKKIFPGVTGYNVATDSLFYYAKDINQVKYYAQYKKREKEPAWIAAHSPGIRRPPERVLDGVTYYPPKGRHWTFKQSTLDRMKEEGRIRLNLDKSYVDLNGEKINGLIEYRTADTELLDSNWTDITGYSSSQGFKTENSEALLKRAIQSASSQDDIVLDFFLGSGTTIATAQKLKRKWVGVEMGDHFSTVILRRMKRIVSGIKENISRDKDVEYEGGGFFKYYTLEQYEDTLNKATYKDDNVSLFNLNESPFEQYIFMRDDKLTDKLEFQESSVDLRKLYDDIDIAESISCQKGVMIKKITEDKAYFDDGSVIDLKNINVEDIKAFVWWC
ncbi:adenine specific DNA methylase Mod [Gracilibacillus halotolerans]|uniref:Adenine specific DNA methylase Mod n=1 Tax=Gracilibacillus halotolerans TaxID=74386 RepID=A0A841RLR9_9BACI|nr:site-specific DNA-methyltransferase [Gracilibacillus halotolerans]MBB6512563.1 adenine specific DNA methylase Mod [Gracilibacillus halotolerans]